MDEQEFEEWYELWTANEQAAVAEADERDLLEAA